jgi:hypothetical protein
MLLASRRGASSIRTRATPKLNPPPQRKLYTIHLREKQKPFVFHIQEEADSASLCYLVCFEKADMAKQMVRLLQHHYALKGEWPPTDISPEHPLDLAIPDDAPAITDDVWATLPKVWIHSWLEPELDTYAKINRLNLFEIRSDQTVRMFLFEYELESLQALLEKSLDI